MVLFRLMSGVTKGSAAFRSRFGRVGRKESEVGREFNNLLYKERCSQQLANSSFLNSFTLFFFFAELCWRCVELWASCLATICYGCRRTVGMDELHRCCPTPAGAQRQFMVGHDLEKKNSEWRKWQKKTAFFLFKWNTMTEAVLTWAGVSSGRFGAQCV